MSLLDGNRYNGRITRIAEAFRRKDSTTDAINYLRRMNEQTKYNEEEIEI